MEHEYCLSSDFLGSNNLRTTSCSEQLDDFNYVRAEALHPKLYVLIYVLHTFEDLHSTDYINVLGFNKYQYLHITDRG